MMQSYSSDVLTGGMDVGHSGVECLEYVPLESISTPTVNTVAAAHYLHLKPQTLRMWACKECGPIRPRRINGRLHWNVNEIRRLLGVK